jgi:transposase
MEVFMKKLSKSGRTRRSFTPEFKAEAVRIARTPGKTIAQAARELDLTENSLRAWVKQAEADEHPEPQGPLTTDERAELTRLRRELRTAEQELDFLKKAAAYFARNQS